MGYNPDPMLSALANYRLANQDKPIQATLAWINLFQSPEKLRAHELFNQYWLGASKLARHLGFHLEEFRWADLPLHRMDSIFKARGIRGILISPTQSPDAMLLPELDQFPWKDYATVRFGESIKNLEVNFISSAQVSNTILAYEQIRRKGYRRIGFVGDYQRKMLFSAGYLWAQQAMPRQQRLSPLLYQNEDAGQLQALLKKWIEHEQPDAIIAGTPILLELLKKLGFKIPQDIALASMSTYDNPIDAGIDQNPAEIGRVAIRSLVSQLNENKFGIPAIQKETLVEGHWTDGPMMPSRP